MKDSKALRALKLADLLLYEAGIKGGVFVKTPWILLAAETQMAIDDALREGNPETREAPGV